MIDNSNGLPFCSRSKEEICLQVNPSILTLQIPDAEEIAKAIWQRQHDALAVGAISYSAKWRDQSIPLKFWDEFLLDAHAVLLLLEKKRTEYENTRA